MSVLLVYSTRELRLMEERDAALFRAERAEAALLATKDLHVARAARAENHVAKLRTAIGVMVPLLLGIYIELTEKREPSEGRDVDLKGARGTLERIQAAMAETDRGST